MNKNIVSVAATRAKFRFYMIGDQTVWTCKPVKIARNIIANTITASDLENLLHLKKETILEQNSFEPQNDFLCPRCGNLLLRKTGRYGEFLGCSDYPTCKYTKSL